MVEANLFTQWRNLRTWVFELKLNEERKAKNGKANFDLTTFDGPEPETVDNIEGQQESNENTKDGSHK